MFTGTPVVPRATCVISDGMGRAGTCILNQVSIRVEFTKVLAALADYCSQFTQVLKGKHCGVGEGVNIPTIYNHGVWLWPDICWKNLQCIVQNNANPLKVSFDLTCQPYSEVNIVTKVFGDERCAAEGDCLHSLQCGMPLRWQSVTAAKFFLSFFLKEKFGVRTVLPGVPVFSSVWLK